MNRTSIALVALVTLPIAAPFGAVAQQSRTMRHIGVLGNLEAEEAVAAFRQGLREAGYVEGQNLVIEHRRFARGSAEGLTTKAADLVRLKVEVIWTQGPAALRAAANTTRQIPIVALDMISDPVEAGFAKSLSRPGGNVTGFFLDRPELIGKWLELLKDTLPRLSHVAVLWDPASGPYQLRAARSAGRVLGVRLQTLEARNADDFEGAFAAARREQAEAMILLSSPLVYFNLQRLAELASKNRMPAIAYYHGFPEAAGLMSYGQSGDLLVYILRSNGARWGESSMGPSQATCRLSSPSSSSWSSTLRRPRRSASRSRSRCCCGRMSDQMRAGGVRALTLALGVLVVPLAADAQQAATIPRIGVLGPAGADLYESFRQGLREFGYEEGRNMSIDSLGADSTGFLISWPS